MRVVPDRTLMEMCLTGETMSAGEAAQQRLVNYAVPAAELNAKMDWLVERVTSKSPTGIRLGKQSLARMREMSFDGALEYAPVHARQHDPHHGRARGLRGFRRKARSRLDRGMIAMARTVRIGCGAGFWGDTPEGPAQLVQSGRDSTTWCSTIWLRSPCRSWPA